MHALLLELYNRLPPSKRVHASVCCISLCFLQSITSLLWFPFDSCLPSSPTPLSLFKFISICSHCFPFGSCVILIKFFYNSFPKDISSNIFHKGTCPEQEKQEQTRNIYLEEMLVHLANKYNKHLYQ